MSSSREFSLTRISGRDSDIELSYTSILTDLESSFKGLHLVTLVLHVNVEVDADAAVNDELALLLALFLGVLAGLVDELLVNVHVKQQFWLEFELISHLDYRLLGLLTH